MSSVYKVTEIDGKGLGCVAIANIGKGSLILDENPQLVVESEEKPGTPQWIKSLLKSFNGMSKSNQIEYMLLHNQFNNLQGSQPEYFENFEKSKERKLNEMKLEICRIEKNPGKVEEILKIWILPINHFSALVPCSII